MLPKLAGPIVGSIVLALGGYFSADAIVKAEYRAQETNAAYADYVSASAKFVFSDDDSEEEERAELQWYAAESRIALYGSPAVIETVSEVRSRVVSGLKNASADPAQVLCKALSPALLAMREDVQGDALNNPSQMQVLVFGMSC